MPNDLVGTATLKSIAEATGFSVTTVSRALGGFDDVSTETRRAILAEAERQGYMPNPHARALRGQRAQAVGLIMPTYGPRFSDPFFSEFIAGVGNQATSAGFDLLLSTHAPGPGELETYRRLVAGRRVGGLILVRTRADDPRINYLATTRMPFVVFGRTISPYPIISIDVDGVAGQTVLTQHFIDLGHRRIAYIVAPQNLMFARYRLQGYTETLERNHLALDPRLIVEGDLTERGGKQAVELLLKLPDPPTAIMTGNDLMAFGVMGSIQEHGLRVGEDIAVGGFDDIPSAEAIHPGLTTIRQPIYGIAEQLTDMLLGLIAGKEPAERSVLLAPELVIRASSGPARLSAFEKGNRPVKKGGAPTR